MDVNYNPLINRALRMFNVREKLNKSVSVDAAFLNPFITIAREPGSGGAPIARSVAERLGFEFVDDSLIEEVARSTRRRSAIIKEIDEKSRSKIDDFVHSILNVEYVGEEDYITALVTVIVSHAHKGKCVILGRGGNFITPFAKGLHVNITAPYEVRVQRAMDYEGHSREKAKEVIVKVEREREDFVRQYFNANAKQRNAFDLSINTTYFNVLQSRDLIVEAFRQKFRL